MTVNKNSLPSKARAVRALGVGALALIGFFSLAHAVGTAPDPPWMMGWEHALVDHSSLVAWWFTWFGYVQILGPICLVVALVAWRVPSFRPAAVLLFVALLLAWRGADFFQHLFARPRRLDWVVKHETAFSFPSSHAAIATAFYGSLALLLWRSGLRGARWWGLAVAALAVGIVWSRLALGAHYATDLIGGILWGLAVVASLSSAINVFEARAPRP